MVKLPQITKSKQVGKNLNVVIGDETFTITGDKDTLQKAKDAITVYQSKPIKKNYESLMKLLKPATTAKKEKIEEEKNQTKAAIKANKKKVVKKESTVSKGQRNLMSDLEKAVGSGELSKQDKAKMRKLLADAEEINKQEPKAKETPSRRRGEY